MMKKIGILFLGIFLLSTQAAFAAVPAWITVAAQTTISGPDIHLGDIAQIHCEDDSRVAQLAALKIGNAPPPGRKVVLKQGEFMARLAITGAVLDEISWDMPESITAVTRAQTVTGAELVRLAQSSVEEKLKEQKIEQSYTLDILYTPYDIEMPEGNAVYQVELPYGVKQNAPTNAIVRIYIDDQLYKSVQTRFRLHVYDQVVVANRSLASRDVVTAADVRLESSDTSKMAPGYLTDLNAAIGLVTTRVINKDMALTKAMLDKPVLMKRMAMVEIQAVIGGIKVRMEGQAMQDGKEGQMIRVKNTKSGRVITGKVIGDSTVEVTSR